MFTWNASPSRAQLGDIGNPCITRPAVKLVQLSSFVDANLMPAGQSSCLGSRCARPEKRMVVIRHRQLRSDLAKRTEERRKERRFILHSGTLKSAHSTRCTDLPTAESDTGEKECDFSRRGYQRHWRLSQTNSPNSQTVLRSSLSTEA